MAVRLTTTAAEKSTYIITVTFKDEDGNLEAPTSADWTLTTVDGTVVNSRENIPISAPSSTENIILSGDDLALLEGDRLEERILAIEAVYDSVLGNDLPLKQAIRFHVMNLKAVSD